ncbi:hypothetical protein ACGMNB_01850 [Shewanella oncorhynchi]|uniref:hypothetical protein n=1 Tax=Shewanella oncorhynchi TaxID=2726434 RepID=UPI0037454B27
MSARSSGRSSIGHGAFIPDRVMDSESYYCISSGAAKLLTFLCRQYKQNPRNGRGNNGNLTVAASVIGESCGSKNAITRYKNELLAAELIVCTRQPKMTGTGRFSTALYGLSWLPIDDIWVKGISLDLDIKPTIAPVRTNWVKPIVGETKKLRGKLIMRNERKSDKYKFDLKPTGLIQSWHESLTMQVYRNETKLAKVFTMIRETTHRPVSMAA